VHTLHSHDSLAQAEPILARAVARGIGCLAITDHNTIEAAHRMVDNGRVQIIVGEEIATREGEMIGLWLHEAVSPGMSALETARAIRKQGGLVVLPHPYDVLRSGIAPAISPELLELVDAIEVWNARCWRPRWNRQALQLAQRYDKFFTAGSDAHLAHEVGQAWIELPEFHNRDSFAAALQTAGHVKRCASRHSVHLSSTLAKLVHRLHIRRTL